MPRADIVREITIARTARVMQVESIFDVPPSQRSGERWSVDLALPDAWSIGVIVGPSGSGKTTVAREVFGANIVSGWDWPTDKSILDGFPREMGIKEIVELLSSVGFSSPPSCRIDKFMSNITKLGIENSNGNFIELRDFYLADYSSDPKFTFEVDPGTYNKLLFGLGLPSAYNKNQDPAQYPSSSPLSVAGSQGMFWHWDTRLYFYEIRRKSRLIRHRRRTSAR